MKKKIEAELISIAHRILQMKNRSDVNALHKEVEKLYSALSVLKFTEEYLSEPRPSIVQSDVESALEKMLAQPEEEEAVAEVEMSESEESAAVPTELPHVEPEIQVEQSAPQTEEATVQEAVPQESAEDNNEAVTAEERTDSAPEATGEQRETSAAEVSDPVFTPAFEWAFEQSEEAKETPQSGAPESALDVQEKMAQAEIAFEDLLGPGYKDPVFVKSDEAQPATPVNSPIENVIPITRKADSVQVIKMNNTELADRTVSLNDRLSKGITVGLNDRIAFVKHLFNNSNEDYNRVLSQLITFSTMEEAREFIDHMVKPDYNNWIGKEEYEERFLEVVEKKFL